jgi:opacity protein-like surface antigen
MPMDRQIRYAAGVQHEWSDTVTVGGQFVYADYGKGEIDNPNLKGDYKSNDIIFLALNANWKF